MYKHRGSGRDTIETKLAVRNVNADVLVACSICDLLGKVLELFIECRSSPALFLLLLELFLVTELVAALTVTGVIELHFCSFADELNILGFLLAQHDGVFEMNVDDDNEFMLRRLEE